MFTRELSQKRARAGFTLVELLVVLLIFGILMAIAVPTLISTVPQRNLAAAGDRFAQDFNYARAKAQATKNRVFIAFETSPDDKQVEGVYPPSTGGSILGGLLGPTANGTAYVTPSNPGVSRVAKSYIIVEERPRFKPNPQAAALSKAGTDARGERYTYLNWLNDYDRFTASNARYPVEPTFPYSVLDTTALGTGLDPKLGPFNGVAAPLAVYPQDIATLSGATDFLARHLSVIRAGGIDWSTADPNDQQFKIFDIEDQASILAMDDNVRDTLTGERFYDAGADNPKVQDQVVDYVLLKRVTLPEHCSFVNPWKDSWVVSWDDTNGDGNADVYNRQDMQFLQYLWVFEPPGRNSTFGGVKLGVWTYDPEIQANGNPWPGQTHGTIRVFDDLSAARHMWMVLDECVDSETPQQYPSNGGPANFGAVTSVLGGTNSGNIQANRKVNMSGSARMFTFWTLGSKYYVDDYTPNDVAAELDPADPRLNENYIIPAGSAGSTIDSPLVAREFGYNRNFLVPGTRP